MRTNSNVLWRYLAIWHSRLRMFGMQGMARQSCVCWAVALAIMSIGKVVFELFWMQRALCRIVLAIFHAYRGSFVDSAHVRVFWLCSCIPFLGKWHDFRCICNAYLRKHLWHISCHLFLGTVIASWVGHSLCHGHSIGDRYMRAGGVYVLAHSCMCMFWLGSCIPFWEKWHDPQQCGINATCDCGTSVPVCRWIICLTHMHGCRIHILGTRCDYCL